MQKSHETGVRDASNGAIRSEDSARDPSALNGHLTSSEESSSSEGDSHSILNNLLPDFEGYSTDPRAPPSKFAFVRNQHPDHFQHTFQILGQKASGEGLVGKAILLEAIVTMCILSK